MDARMLADSAQMEARIKALEERLQQADSRRLYNSAWFNDSTEDDYTGTMSFIPEITTAMGTTWTILCGALVMFMNAGFALLESGVCRSVSCQSVFLKNMLDACFGTILWFTIGYTLMYGEDATGTMVIHLDFGQLFGMGMLAEDGSP